MNNELIEWRKKVHDNMLTLSVDELEYRLSALSSKDENNENVKWATGIIKDLIESKKIKNDETIKEYALEDVLNFLDQCPDKWSRMYIKLKYLTEVYGIPDFITQVVNNCEEAINTYDWVDWYDWHRINNGYTIEEDCGRLLLFKEDTIDSLRADSLKLSWIEFDGIVNGIIRKRKIDGLL